MDRLDPYLRCGECERNPADFDCLDCKESYCAECMEAVHGKGLRRQHSRNRKLYVCQICVAAAATGLCSECDERRQYMCDACSAKIHGPKGRGRRHKEMARLGDAAGGGKSGDAKANAEAEAEDASRNAFGIRVNGLAVGPQRYPEAVEYLESRLRDLADAREPTPQRSEVADTTAADESAPAAKATTSAPATSAFTDVETDGFSLGPIANRTSAWRRVTKAFPRVVLFGAPANRVLQSSIKPPPALLAALPQALYGPDPTQFQLAALPRFVAQEGGGDGGAAIDEGGFDLAFLAVALRRGLLSDVFASAQHRDVGCYMFKFHDEASLTVNLHRPAGTPSDRSMVTRATLRHHFDPPAQFIIVDDVVPLNAAGVPLFGSTVASRRTEVYKMLLMKAYAKRCGSYAALSHANPVAVLRRLTCARTLGFWWGTGDDGSAPAVLQSSLIAACRFAWWIADSCGKRGCTVIFARRNVAKTPRADKWGTAEGAEELGGLVEGATGGVLLRAAEVSSAQASALGAKHRRNTLVRGNDSFSGRDGAATEASTDSSSPFESREMFRLIKLALPHSSAATEPAVPASPPSPSGDDQSSPVTPPSQQPDATVPSLLPRFTYHFASPLWTKELREAFDFTQGDDDVAFGTPADVAHAFDGVVVGCHNDDTHGVISAPVFQLETDGGANAAERRIVIRVATRDDCVPRLAARVDCFDLNAGYAVPATSALTLQCVVLPQATADVLHSLNDIVDAALVDDTVASNKNASPTKPFVVSIDPVVQTNAMLGLSVTRPDLFIGSLLPPAVHTTPPSPQENQVTPMSSHQSGSDRQPNAPTGFLAVLVVRPQAKRARLLVTLDFGNASPVGSTAAASQRNGGRSTTFATTVIAEFAHILAT